MKGSPLGSGGLWGSYWSWGGQDGAHKIWKLGAHKIYCNLGRGLLINVLSTQSALNYIGISAKVWAGSQGWAQFALQVMGKHQQLPCEQR